MPSPKAFSSLLKDREPFDWPSFWKDLPWQPVPQWIVVSALAGPFSRAFPTLSRAACMDPARAMIAQSAFVVYTAAVPVLVSVLLYLLFGRRRMAKRTHRLIGDVTLGLIVVLGLGDAFVLYEQARSQWPTLAPALKSLRAACWP